MSSPCWYHGWSWYLGIGAAVGGLLGAVVATMFALRDPYSTIVMLVGAFAGAALGQLIENRGDRKR